MEFTSVYAYPLDARRHHVAGDVALEAEEEHDGWQDGEHEGAQHLDGRDAGASLFVAMADSKTRPVRTSSTALAPFQRHPRICPCPC